MNEVIKSFKLIKMTHFTVLLIIAPSTNNIEEKVREMMSPYYSYIEVEPYREYLRQEVLAEEVKYLRTLPQEEINEIAKDYEVESNSLETLARAKLEWSDELVDGVDEKGVYRIATHNPQGKWDWYRFIEEENVDSSEPVLYPCRVSDIPKAIPYAIITPDGQWHELGEEAGLKAFARQLKGGIIMSEEEIQWEQKVQEIKAVYSDYSAVALHCHD